MVEDAEKIPEIVEKEGEASVVQSKLDSRGEPELESEIIPHCGVKTSDKKWVNLLNPHKIIRDAVHGDIQITELETEIIDTKIFQRLHGLKQLGHTYLIYPCAKHTRFEHSLGVLYVAQKIINSTKENYKYKKSSINDSIKSDGNEVFQLFDRDVVLIRLTALLHDAAHIPFGHTLEKEGNLFKKTQWADPDRFKKLFDGCFSDIIDRFLKKKGLSDEETSALIKDLGDTLKAIEGIDPKTDSIADEDDAISKLNYPYVGDIVGNTICADLLDYLKRDSHFTGFKLTYDPRIMKDFAIIGTSKEKARLTLLLIKKGKKRCDLISSAINLLEQRYYLAEAVYYHRVKKAVSAMMINVVYSAIEENLISKGDLINWTDDELQYNLETKAKDVTETESYGLTVIKNTLGKLQERKIYKPVYSIQYQESNSKIEDLIKKYKKPDERYKVQKELETPFMFSPGTIILYVSKKDKGKEALAKGVWEGGKIKLLRELTGTTTQKQIDITNKRYAQLWTLYVFMDKDKIYEQLHGQTKSCGQLVAGRCKRLFRMSNDIEDREFNDEPDILDLYKTIAESYRTEVHHSEPIDSDRFEKFVEGFRQRAKDVAEGAGADARPAKSRWGEETPDLESVLDMSWDAR
jgi:HD superfamily phosphohydrolase